ncbi:hypothetical protein B0T10DRAFT_580868 [Thelonectria olida]|uniref:Uncharacterized protein n=1 Tax=Thelonectria olida TaxID=1576542 RepID=A0A9P8VXH3_9HYPO|nr:hypothetical protein B0T10DRAFT_580868 [Thelonectria olida]
MLVTQVNFTTSETGLTNHELGKEWLIESSVFSIPLPRRKLETVVIIAFSLLMAILAMLIWTFSSFSPENIASGWKRTGLRLTLMPFDPEVVLSQITEKVEADSDTGSDSAESLALQQPTARDLRRLVDKSKAEEYSRKTPLDARRQREFYDQTFAASSIAMQSVLANHRFRVPHIFSIKYPWGPEKTVSIFAVIMKNEYHIISVGPSPTSPGREVIRVLYATDIKTGNNIKEAIEVTDTKKYTSFMSISFKAYLVAILEHPYPYQCGPLPRPNS